MFETSIFSSFIPQLFMVVAYVSCLLAPKLGINNHDVFIDASSEKHIEIHSPILEKVDFSQTFHSVVSDFYIANNAQFDFSIKHYIAIDSAVPRSQTIIPKAFLQSCFSRPPPVFC